MVELEPAAPRFARAEVSRRTAVSGLGGVGLAMLTLCTSSPRVLAQAGSGTPVSLAAAGYLVIRQYRLASGISVDDLIQQIQDGFVPIIREVPGFVAYFYLHEPDSNITASISLFADEAGAEESTRRAADWVAENNVGVYEGPPEVVAGQVDISETAS